MSSGKTLNERQMRFAEAVASGDPATVAYEKAGYRGGKNAETNASRLKDNEGVKAYIEELRKPRVEATLLTIEEKRAFLARAVRVPLGDVDEKDPLCVELSYTAHGKKLKKVDPTKAIELDSKLAGHFAPEKHSHEIPGLAEFFASFPKSNGLPSKE